MEFTNKENPRPAAKALLHTESGKRLFVYGGGAGALTLPGGGMKYGESAEIALVRELREELGIVVQPSVFRYRGNIAGDVTSKSGAAFTAHWEVFQAIVPEEAMPEQYLHDGIPYHNIGGLALQAIQEFPFSR